MKRVALLLCLLCLFQSGHALIVVNARVNFGARKYACEKGLGICLLQVDSRSQGEQGDISLSVSRDGSRLQIDFPTATFTLFPEQFRDEKFVQEEDYVVPAEVAKELGIAVPFRIPAGNYSLQDMGDRRRIVLSVGN